MFQFRRFPSHTYLIQYGIPCGGFPHSEISGSMLICSSPKLIAAYHVLHRLLMPRHSPCALCSLTYLVIYSKSSQFWFSQRIVFNKYFILACCINNLYPCAIFKEQIHFEKQWFLKIEQNFHLKTFFSVRNPNFEFFNITS